MNDSSTERLLNGFIDGVRTLLDRFRSLRSRVNSLEDKLRDLEEKNQDLERRNQQLKEDLDDQRLRFSELAGELEMKFDRIKDEAGNLLPENQE